MEGHSENVVRSREVIGVSVKNLDKENLGKIEEIVLDKITGQVRYVVLSFNELLGFGEKYFAFPWKAISYSKENKSFILNVDKDQLKEEHGFDKDSWPDIAQWTAVETYYQ